MKNINHSSLNSFILLCCLAAFLNACTGYKYYAAPVNTAIPNNAGNIQFSGELGTSGGGLKAAAGLTDHFGLMAQYNSAFYTYSSSEYELGAGYYAFKSPGGIFLCTGVNFGNTRGYTDTTRTVKEFEGNFYRPFVQLNYGVDGGTIFHSLKGDIQGAFKGGYMFYNGNYLDGSGDEINSQYFLFEPSLLLGLGGPHFRFTLQYSFPLHPTFELMDKHFEARTYPLTINAGLKFSFGQKAKTEAGVTE